MNNSLKYYSVVNWSQLLRRFELLNQSKDLHQKLKKIDRCALAWKLGGVQVVGDESWEYGKNVAAGSLPKPIKLWEKSLETSVLY